MLFFDGKLCNLGVPRGVVFRNNFPVRGRWPGQLRGNFDNYYSRAAQEGAEDLSVDKCFVVTRFQRNENQAETKILTAPILSFCPIFVSSSIGVAPRHGVVHVIVTSFLAGERQTRSGFHGEKIK